MLAGQKACFADAHDPDIIIGKTALTTGAQDALVSSKLVHEVMEHPEQFRDRELRVAGQPQRGSVQFQTEPSAA